MSSVICSTNGWIVNYYVNNDGSVYANITDNNGR